MTVKSTEQIAKSASTSKTGLFAALRGLFRIGGSAAPKMSQGTGAPARRLLLSLLAATLGALALTAAPALAALETPEKEEVTAVTATTTHVSGVLNPKATGGVEGGFWGFRYGVSEPAVCGAEKLVPEPFPGAGIAAGLPKEVKEETLTGLQPHAKYTVCLLELDTAQTEQVEGTPVPFETLAAAPTITGDYTSDVEGTVATLNASIDPGGAATSYQFEYLTETQYQANGETYTGASTTTASAPLPADDAEHAATASLKGLASGTSYRYRVVTQSTVNGTPTRVDGPNAAFTTPGVPGTAAETCPNAQARAEQPYAQVLPDCRAYEMVSPLEKNGEGVETADALASVANGNAGEEEPALAYLSIGSFAEPKGAPEANRYISRRGQDGWSTQNVTPPTVAFGSAPVPFAGLLFTPELSKGAFTQAYVPLLEGEPEGYIKLFVADFADGSYQPVTPETSLARPFTENLGLVGFPELMGASTDLSHVVFTRNGYTFVSVGGKVSPLGEGVGVVGGQGAFAGESKGTWHAVSENGRRIVTSGEQVYVSENPEQQQSPVNGQGECTEPALACVVEVSASQKTNGTGPRGTDPNSWGRYDNIGEFIIEAGGPVTRPAFYLDASADGERVFFTSRAELTNDADTGPADNVGNLYEYDLATKELTDLTVPTEAEQLNHEDPDGAAVVGLVNAAQNAGEENSYLYFVANGILAAGAKPGDCPVESGNTGKEKESYIGERTCNLYVEHFNNGEWESPKFIATLSGSEGSTETGAYKRQEEVNDEADWRGTENREDGTEYGPAYHTARVTPDGSELAFVSERSLTGYDTEQASQGDCEGDTGETYKEIGKCHEVYLFNAVTGKLVCASCDPSGARPTGPSTLGGHETNAFSYPSPTYLPRNLSEDGGRLFFQSRDALVPHASDGKLNVYEWERPAAEAEVGKSENSCAASSSTFSANSGGCVFAISDVAGAYQSHFMDATPNGENVFITTQDQLVPADTDTREDAYDVRVGGGFPVTAAAPVCTNADSCKPPVSPQPGVFAAPGSATFSGPGNPAAAVTMTLTPKKKTAAEIKAEQLTKALKQCEKQKRKVERERCDASARKKYGASKAKKAKRASNDRRAK